jgi:hypothetical protein
MGKKKWLFILSAFLALPLALSAWDSRIYSLGAPTLSLSGAVPTGFANFVFPTDEYGLGLSAVPDALDVFILPQQLANSKLFPSTSIILDSTVLINPNGGIVMGLGKQFVLGVFLFRPTLNGWVTGAPRANLAGLGGSYTADSGVAVTAPTVPANLADVIFAARLGTLLVGGGVGFSYSQAANDSSSIVGTANSTTTNTSSGYVITGRLGASLPLGPVAFDASALLMYGSESASRVSGAAAAIPNLNNSLTAGDFTFSVNARAIVPLAAALDLVALADFALLPQNYSASTAAGAVTTTTALIDSTQFLSFGGGAGVNWKPAEPVMLNALLTVVYGTGSWVSQAAGVTPRPTNSEGWLTFRPVLDGEFKIASWVTLRGGVFAVVRWVTTTTAANTGGTTTVTQPVELGAGANAGFGFQITDKAALDILLNLVNFDGTGGGIQVPGLSASLKVDL